MVHGIRLDGGTAEWYRNRYVQTTKLRSGLDAMDPEVVFDPTASAANTHVLAHAGRIWALEEGHLPYELSPELDTLGCEDFDGKLTTAFTAHPKLCPETGELHFFGYSPVAPFLTYHVLDASGALVHSAEITVPAGTMMHDFMITRDHAIFMDLPVVFDLSNLRAPLKWDESYGARIGIVPRMGADADVQWFEIHPCYVFHPLNAYVDGDNVVCDVGRHEYMWRDSMNDFPPSYMYRWRFDLAAGTSSEQQLDGDAHAFPRVDDRVVGLRHRYGWGVAPRSGGRAILGDAGKVVKWDFDTGAQGHYDFGPRHRSGRPGAPAPARALRIPRELDRRLGALRPPLPGCRHQAGAAVRTRSRDSFGDPPHRKSDANVMGVPARSRSRPAVSPAVDRSR